MKIPMQFLEISHVDSIKNLRIWIIARLPENDRQDIWTSEKKKMIVEWSPGYIISHRNTICTLKSYFFPTEPPSIDLDKE